MQELKHQMPYLNVKKNNVCSRSHKMADDKRCEVFSDLKKVEKEKQWSIIGTDRVVFTCH